jgi:hypothetical protein
METTPALKYGILKCRDLVELYYGVRMAFSLVENEVLLDGNVDFLIGQDPRRVRYEIILAAQPSSVASCFIGTPPTFDLGTSQQYSVAAGGTLVIVRDWLTDGDAVTLPLAIQNNTDITFGVSTRETFLTPIPADELP